MATGTVYLDVDDEITSAAARIRSSEATKVALVVPYGSRIATSRMNFRLLSREAVVNNRRLSIVASDPATRALAASAGLPVFASVTEFDTATAGGAETGPTDDGASRGGGAAAGAAGAAGAAAGAIAAGAAGIGRATGAAGAAIPSPSAQDATSTSPAEPTQPTPVVPRSEPTPAQEPTLDPATTATTSMAAAAAAASVAPTTVMPAVAPAPAASAPTRPTGQAATTTKVPITRSRRLPRIGPMAIVMAGLAILALVVAGVAAYVYLPSAEITLTPREEPIPPISLTVRADPDATSTDAAAGIVPAQKLDVPVEVTDTFATKGRRVEEATATGSVTFESYNFLDTNTIPAGSVVSTEGGIRFVTQRSITLPKATFVLPSVVPSRASVGVTAANAGTEGNVPANAIRVVPKGEDPELTKVRNPDETSGGTHEEFPQVSEAEVTAALASLNKDLTAAFTTAVADTAANPPEGTTVYPATAVMGQPTPTVDPATLVGQEVESFDLGLTASGKVIAVDDSPVEGIARQRLLGNVGSGYRLVDGSIEITPGEPTVANGEVTFPVTASAARVKLLNAADLLGRVKGRSVEDAKAALAPLGDVEVSTWPDWVTSVPSIDSRVTLVIVGQDGSASPGGSARPGGSPRPASAAPTSPSPASPPASAAPASSDASGSP
jgi:hypothetical protein